MDDIPQVVANQHYVYRQNKAACWGGGRGGLMIRESLVRRG